ncbi:MAG: nucleoid-associated protein [Saprospiraceae bacterium]
MSTQINFKDTAILSLITHHVGNSHYEDSLILSDETSSLSDEATMEYLMAYFLSQFQPVDIQKFTHTIGLEMNEVYSCIKNIFHDENQFIQESKNLTKMLYQHAVHPQIKSGELNVVLFENVELDGISVSAVGIFKSESNVPFLRMATQKQGYFIDHEYGFDLKSLDKACLVFNIDESEGYQAITIDKKNKSDAQYWVDDYLRLTPIADEYNVTKEFLSVTKDFLTDELPSIGPLERTDQIDMLNRTMDYFKGNETFNKEEFENEVFQSDNVISSFRNFEEGLAEEQQPQQSFYISEKAVKKQARIYKSVLKLDKNFHVYIHGNRDMIEKGVDEEGRKYYKIYYEEEN